jgi:holin-like protein
MINMKAMKGFFIILISLMVGNLITALTKLPIPGSIFGMLILLVLLETKIVKLETVDPAAGALLSVMIMLFVPGAVNLINVYDKFDGVIIQVFAIVVVTTIVVMAVTGIVAEQMIKAKKKRGKE